MTSKRKDEEIKKMSNEINAALTDAISQATWKKELSYKETQKLLLPVNCTLLEILDKHMSRLIPTTSTNMRIKILNENLDFIKQMCIEQINKEKKDELFKD